MKRWIAVMLAAILLLTGSLAAAEGAGGTMDAETREAMEPQKEENVGTLIKDLVFLVELLQNEDVRNLFQLRDVQDLMNEGVYRVLVWMVENRPVTMKILVELGVGESGLRCIDIIWDGAERIETAWRSLTVTEEGKQLLAELAAVRDDPEIQKSAAKLWAVISSDEVATLLDSFWNTVINGSAPEPPQGALTQEAQERQMDTTTFTGGLLIELLKFVEESEWAQESIPALLINENLWRLLIHLSKDNEVYRVIREEFRILAEASEIKALLQQMIQEITDLYQRMLEDPDQLTMTETDDASHEEAHP